MSHLVILAIPFAVALADSDSPKGSTDCKGGTISANLIVIRVPDTDIAQAKASLITMRGVSLVESIPETNLVRVVANDMGITVDRVVQFLHLAGYEAEKARKEDLDIARSSMQDEPERIIVYRSSQNHEEAESDGRRVNESESVFPDTTAGQLAKAYIEAFNSGSADKMRDFERKHRSDVALRSRAMDDRIRQYESLYARWGWLTVRGVEYKGDRDITVEVLGTKSETGIRAGFELEESTHNLNLVRLTPSLMGVELPGATPDRSVQVISIADSIKPLKKRFNEHKGKPRFVAILSPT